MVSVQYNGPYFYVKFIIIVDDTANKLPFRLGIVNGVYGYYQLNNTFKSFRQPTGNAGAAQVLQSSGANNTGTKYTASNASSDGFAGTMVNRGALNWSGSNTTATVAAGYYSGGTLDSRPSYNAGVAAGTTSGAAAARVGNAGEAQVLKDYTFTNASGSGKKGTMPNNGALNWSGSNTTKTVAAGYYSGGTLDSRPSYNAGKSAGITEGQATKLTYYEISRSKPSGTYITRRAMNNHTISVGNYEYPVVVVVLMCGSYNQVKISCSSGTSCIPAQQGGQWGYYGGCSYNIFIKPAKNATISFRCVNKDGSNAGDLDSNDVGAVCDAILVSGLYYA